MVFETLVANLLNKYLSEFVDELTAKQLNLFAWSGSVSLDNIEIKANAFDSLSLPFRVSHGHIGRIEASIPWKSLYSSPVVIKLSDVYVIAIPNTESKYDETTELLIQWNEKRKQLSKIEDAKSRAVESREGKPLDKSDDNFSTKFAAQIVKNLQVFINNIHICYEDTISWPNNPFQVGVTLHKLVFETQNTDKDNSRKDADDMIYKLVTLEGLSVYWNCNETNLLSRMEESVVDSILKSRIATRDGIDPHLHYILWPINFTSDAVINRKPESNSYSTPIVDLNMVLDVFELRLTRLQLESSMLLLDAIDRMNLAKPYRKWRPMVPIKGNSKYWWKFAFNSILETQVKPKANVWSWNWIKSHRKLMKDYQELYKQKLLNKNVDLQEFEKKLNIFSIVLARSQAEMETKQILQNKKPDDNKRWFSWWGKKQTSTEVSSDDIVDGFKQEMTLTEKAKLYKAIGYEEDIPNELPYDFIAHKIQFTINKLLITISDANEKITQLSLLTTNLKIIHRPSSRCSAVDTFVKSVYISGKQGIPILEEQHSSTDVLSLSLDINPIHSQYDYGINMKMCGMKMIYDTNTITCLIEMLSPPNDVSLNELQAIASFKFQNWTQRTATGLEYAIEKHKQIKINIDIEPSYLIVPQLGRLENANNILLISLGHVNISSKLIPKTQIPKVRDLVSSHSDHDLMVKMREMAYESYKFDITQVQLVLSDSDNWKTDLESLSTDRHILYPVELKVTIDHSIIPNDPHLAKLIIKGELPNIKLKISDQQMKILFNLLFTLPFGSNSKPQTESISDLKPSNVNKISNRNIQTIDSQRLIVDAINLAKESAAKIVDNQNVFTDSVEPQQVIAYKSIIFDFSLNKISLQLFTGLQRHTQSALASAQLIKFELHGELLTDDSLWISCIIGNLSLSDVRVSRSATGIKTLLEKNLKNTDSSLEKDSMFSLILTQKLNERFIEISMVGFRLILALDYLLNLSDILTKSLDFDEPNIESLAKTQSDSVKLIDEKLTQLAKSKSESLNVMRFNLSQVDIILVESIEVSNSTAIILSLITSIDLKQKPNFIQLSGHVSQISMLLTNYQRYVTNKDIDAFIMKPTEMTVNGTIKGEHQMLDISFSDIRIYISPPMVNIIVNILSQLGSTSDKNTYPTDYVNNVCHLFKPRFNNMKSWYLSYVSVGEEITEQFVDLSHNKTIISNEQQLFLNIQSITIVVESGGLDSQPLVKIDSFFTGKLIGYKSLTANCSLIANYYNENVFAWEPLIEPIEGQTNPWDFKIEVTLENDNKISVKFESDEHLEITITKTSIGVLGSLNEAFAHAVTKQLPTRDENIVIIKNFLGLDLNLMTSENLRSQQRSDSSVSSIKGKSRKMNNEEKVVIKSGDQMSLIARDFKELELNIGIKLNDGNELSRLIACRGHNVRCFNLPKKSYPSNEFWKWVVQVEDTDAFTKTVIFKSNVEIVNKFNTGLDVFSQKSDKQTMIGQIKPLSILELPLDVIYDNSQLMIRPSDDYRLSDIIDWRHINYKNSSGTSCLPLCDTSNGKPLNLSCDLIENDSNKFYFKVKSYCNEVNFEDTNSTANDSVLNQIMFIPIVRLKNLLPYNISYASEGIDKLLDVESGGESDLFNIKLGQTGLSLNLCNYLDRNWHCFKRIPSYGSENEIDFWTFTSDHLTLDLAVNLTIEDSSLVLHLFSPFWMINRTSEQLVYRIDAETVIYHASTVVTPVLLSFKPKSFFCKKKLCLSIGDSRFSDAFSIDVAGNRGNIIAKSKDNKFNYYVTVDIQLSRIGLSKIVTITPFYQIINMSTKSLQISEDNDEWFPIKSNSKQSFWPKKSKHQIIHLRLDLDAVSSRPLSICKSCPTLVRVSGDYIFADVDVTESDATIKLSDYFAGSAPVMLVNALDKAITYGQKDITVWSSRSGTQRHVNILPAFHSVLYTWYEPSGLKQLVWKYDDLINNEQTNDLTCDQLLDVNGIFVVSFLDAKQRILLFTTDLALATNSLQAGEITQPKLSIEFIMKGIGLSIVNNESKTDILYLSITSSVIWEFREVDAKRFKSLPKKSIDDIESSYQKALLNRKVGTNTAIIEHDSVRIDFTDWDSPKIIQPKSGELRRLANRGIWISLKISEHIIQTHIKVHRLQIDNQMPDCIHGIVMCPISPPKSVSADVSPRSFVEISSVIQRTATMKRFKYSSFLMQEFLLQIDRGLLSSLQELFSVAVKSNNNKQLIAKDLKDIIDANSIGEWILSSRKSYYDFIHFSPLKIHVSFSLGGSSGSQFPFGIDFLMRSAGVTLSEFNDVVFKLDYFERKNIVVADSELISIVSKHYTTQVLQQFYVLVLGLEVIGNPMKLVLGLKQGVGDFFYEPIQGIIQGPEEFAEGMALGVKSLATNVFGGAAGALGSITGTLGEGVSVLTMDDKFRRERRTRLNKKSGFAESGKNLFRGVFAGVTGVITQPMEGAKEDGFEGLMKGMGRGVVGIVAQPTTGVIDFASGSLNALKRVIDPKQEAKQMRPSRPFSNDNKLTPYNRNHATGYSILKEMESGKYSTDDYLVHIFINQNSLIMLTNKRIMSVKKGIMSRNWDSEWSEQWTNCAKVDISQDGLKISITTKEQRKKFGLFSADSQRVITTDSVDTSQWLFQRIKKQWNR